MTAQDTKDSLLLQRLRTWPVGEIGKQAADEIARLRDALQMIVDGTICQEAFPDSEDAELEAKTARLIAMAALEKCA